MTARWEEKPPLGDVKTLINEVHSSIRALSGQQLCQNTVYSWNRKEYSSPVLDRFSLCTRAEVEITVALCDDVTT